MGRIKPSKCEKHQNWKYIHFCPVCNYENTIKKIGTLFDAIKHGDEAHQEWLKNKIEEHFK